MHVITMNLGRVGGRQGREGGVIGVIYVDSNAITRRGGQWVAIRQHHCQVQVAFDFL